MAYNTKIIYLLTFKIFILVMNQIWIRNSWDIIS